MLRDDPLEHRRDYAHACDIIARLNRYTNIHIYIYTAHHGGKRVDLDKRRAAEGIKAFRVAEN